MILIEAGVRNAKSFDAKIQFASQLAELGYSVVIDEASLPETLDRSQKFEVAPFLADISDVEIAAVVLIAAENIGDETLLSLRSYQLKRDAVVSAIGRFTEHQALVSCTSKLAFAIGKEANIIDLMVLRKQPFLNASTGPLFSSDMSASKAKSDKPELFVFLPVDWLDEPLNLPMLGAMDYLADFHLNVVIAGSGKEQIRKSKYASISVLGLAELSPVSLAKIADLAVFFGDGIPGERMAGFAMNLIGSGGAVIDCTLSSSFISTGAPVLRGPPDLAALSGYLQNSVLQNLAVIGQEIRDGDWIKNNSIQQLVAELNLPVPVMTEETDASDQVVFMPTNGNGLGHAQRSSLIAWEMKKPKTVSFAAFPSCVNLINDKGFPCLPLVQKSESHPEEFANDIINYLRLKRTLKPGSKFVFDGGYVFDSVYRTIVENSLTATWIRRGLWRSTQVSSAAFSREQAFRNVIVPAEAFDELNTAYTYGQNIHQVGPVVQQSDATPDQKVALRFKLATTFSCAFDTLVITMLGGGYAVDRSAQMQAMATLMEHRENCLHLVVVWPGSKVSTGLSGWKNTHVVKTRNALALCQCADLVVSAAGYNSTHEILYHAIPSILIPQVAPFMDDQEKRALAASERGLAATVLGHEMLLLEREVTAFLEGGKAEQIRQALRDQELPATGNIAAARIIEGGAADV